MNRRIAKKIATACLSLNRQKAPSYTDAQVLHALHKMKRWCQMINRYETQREHPSPFVNVARLFTASLLVESRRRSLNRFASLGLKQMGTAAKKAGNATRLLGETMERATRAVVGFSDDFKSAYYETVKRAIRP